MSAELIGILASLGPARRFADPASPLDARMMAASGALPLPPPQLVSVLVALTHDPDTGVKDKALGSLRTLPDRVIEPALAEKLHPDVLATCAELYKDTCARLEKIALNAAASDETCTFLAGLPLHARGRDPGAEPGSPAALLAAGGGARREPADGIGHDRPHPSLPGRRARRDGRAPAGVER